MTGVSVNFVPNTLARASQINDAFALCYPAASVSPFTDGMLAKTSASQWRAGLGSVAAPVAANDNEVALFDGGASAVKSSGVVWSYVAQINVAQTWTAGQTFNGGAVVPNQTVGAGDGNAANTAYVAAYFGSVFNVTVAPLNNPVFTGDPKAPTPSAGDNDTSIATTAFVQTALTGRIPSSLTQYGVVYGNGTSAIAVTAALTNGQIVVGQTGSAPLPKTVSGDGALAASGALTVTKLNGVPPGSSFPLNAGTGANQLVQLDSNGKLPAIDGSQLTSMPNFRPPDLWVRCERAQNTFDTPANLTVGSYITRALNTIKRNTIGATLATNQITLPAGTYYARWKCVAASNGGSVASYTTRAKLYNVTSGSTIELTNTETSYSSVSASSLNNTGETTFTVGSTTIVDLRQISGINAATTGNVSNVTGEIEIYSSVEIWKVA